MTSTPPPPRTNFLNRTLFHGDNLDFLRGMNSETVDLVATDPPFKKGRDFHATPDSLAAGAKFEDRWSWDKDVHPDWMDAIKDNWPKAHVLIEATRSVSGDDMAAFLCWLGVRVMECHRLLKPTGSLYLHIDHTAHAYVKALLDAIFGKTNFRNEIVWRRMGAHNDFGQGARHFGRIHDILLRYSKGPTPTWNVVHEPYKREYIKKTFRYRDPSGRRYQIQPLHAAKPGGDTLYEWKGHFPPTGRYWAYSKANMERMDAEGRIHYSNTGNPSYKLYLDESKGRTIQDLWDDIAAVYRRPSEKTGYPTQKPLALYERIIKASSKTGDMVLDPFCGCATTPIAAERLERQWVGMDIWDGAFGIVKQRMEDNRQLLKEIPVIHYSTAPPVRTDDGQEAAPDLVLVAQVPEPPGPKMSHAEMKAFLVQRHGVECRGCLRRFDDPRYLDLDHNTPRSDGGLNHVSNRLLLCGPCNRAKSNKLTLSGLRDLNRKSGWMAKG